MDKLLNLLCKNAQFSTAELAAMLNEPEDLIKAQIREYESKGIIKGYQAVVNWESMEDSFVEALIVRGQTMQDIGMFVAKKLSTIEGVLSTGTHFIMRRYKDRGVNLTDFDGDNDERSLIL